MWTYVQPTSLPTSCCRTFGRHLCLQCTWTQPSGRMVVREWGWWRGKSEGDDQEVWITLNYHLTINTAPSFFPHTSTTNTTLHMTHHHIQLHSPITHHLIKGILQLRLLRILGTLPQKQVTVPGQQLRRLARHVGEPRYCIVVYELPAGLCWWFIITKKIIITLLLLLLMMSIMVLILLVTLHPHHHSPLPSSSSPGHNLPPHHPYHHLI